MATKLVSNYSPLGNFCLLYLSPWIFARTFPKMTPTEPFTCTLVLVLSAVFLATFNFRLYYIIMKTGHYENTDSFVLLKPENSGITMYTYICIGH